MRYVTENTRFRFQTTTTFTSNFGKVLSSLTNEIEGLI